MRHCKTKTSSLQWLIIRLLLVAGILAMAGCYPVPVPEIAHSPTSESTQSESGISPSTPISTLGLPTATLPSKIAVQAVNLQGVKINFWHSLSDDAGKQISELTKEFNQNNEWEIIVHDEYQGGADEIDARINEALNKGGLPQLTTGLLFQAQSWNKIRDVIRDWNIYLADPAWGMNEAEKNSLIKPVWDEAVIGEFRWGIPAKRIGQVIFYNTSWAKELGMNTLPKTYQELTQIACTATQANKEDAVLENDSSGGWLISSDYAAILGWLYTFEGSPTSPGKNGYQFNNSETKEALVYLREMFDQGCAWGATDENPEALFSSRRSVIYSNTSASIPYQINSLHLASNPDMWTILPFTTKSGEPVLPVFGPDYFLLESSAEQELASWLFVRWLLKPENQERLIVENSSLPLDNQTLELLKNTSNLPKQYMEVLSLMDNVISEPNLLSWGTVRWAVADASKQLYAWYFEASQIPTLARLLDDTANDLHKKLDAP